MSWRDTLRPASWRGVPFLVETSEALVGRRTVTHEFPGRDIPLVEDLGRATRRWKVDAYLAGADYHHERDRLRRALEQPGAGRLVHPYLGELQVMLEAIVSIRESTQQGGYCSFSLEFVEAGQTAEALTQPSTSAALVAAAGIDPAAPFATQVPATAAAATMRRFVMQVPDSPTALEALREHLGKALAAVRRVRQGMDATGRFVDELERTIAEVESAVDELLNAPAALASAVLGLVGRVVALALRIGDAVADDDDVLATVPADATNATATAPTTSMLFGVLRDLVVELVELPDWVPATPTRLAEVRARREFARLFEGATIVSTCGAVPALPVESSDEARAVRDELAERIDALCADEDCPDEQYSALRDLYVALNTHLMRTASELPRVSIITPTATLPALVVAYQAFGDALREDEILRRNAIAHPAFVLGDRPLEVLR